MSLEGRSEGRSGPAPENDDPNTYPTPGDRSGGGPTVDRRSEASFDLSSPSWSSELTERSSILSASALRHGSVGTVYDDGTRTNPWQPRPFTTKNEYLVSEAMRLMSVPADVIRQTRPPFIVEPFPQQLRLRHDADDDRGGPRRPIAGRRRSVAGYQARHASSGVSTRSRTSGPAPSATSRPLRTWGLTWATALRHPHPDPRRSS